ncbi:hypothetical protein GCM10008014_41140 [Paenibacillus silvae]|uniref:Bacterial toxin 44 domain-containing protein n=1 Tax=Paenibacillus silvae TaxID=1325358 RepID=A0ABQ1ZFI1_9BACL|nr:hypothetical protein [Paenibacillus silvae]GGH63589.1 hypothetical protein GCM10008014_41140 [Paenibacillus silvae]
MKKASTILMAFLLCFSSLTLSKVYGEDTDSNLNAELLSKIGYSQENSLTTITTDITKYAQLGFSSEEVEELTNETIDYLDNIDGELIGADRKYMEFRPNGTVEEISEQDFEKHEVEKKLQQQVENYFSTNSICTITQSGCRDNEITSNWMQLTTTISKINNTNPQEYLIKHDFKWLKTPFYKYKDAVGVAHHTSLTPIQNSEYLTYSLDSYYSRNIIIGAGPWTSEGIKNIHYGSANDKTGGIGFEFPLQNDSASLVNGKQHRYENHRGTVLYRAIRNNSSFTHGDLSGHYIHTESGISGSLGVDAKGTGSFSITPTVKQDAAIQTGVSFKY